MYLKLHKFSACLEARDLAGDKAKVRSLPRSTWEASTKSFSQSAAAAFLCTALNGVIQLKMLMRSFCLLGFRPLEVLSRMTQGKI